MSKIGNHLKANIEFDSKTGKKKVIFLYKGKLCPTIELEKSKIVEQYIGYSLIIDDLEDVLIWLNKVEELIPEKEVDEDDKSEISIKYKPTPKKWKKEGHIVKGLFFSCVMIYAKCFTEAEGRKVKLDKSNLSEDFKDKHEQIIGYRNSFIAHSGKSDWDTGDLYLLLTPVELMKSDGAHLHFQPVNNRLEYEDDSAAEYNFKRLVEFVLDYSKNKKTKIFNKIMKDMIVPKGMEYWYECSGYKLKS